MMRTVEAQRVSWQRVVGARALLVVHITAAVGALGADLALLTLAIATAGGTEPREAAPAAALIATWLVPLLAVLAILTGLALAVTRGWSLTRTGWLVGKQAIALVLLVLLVAVVGPRLRDTADAARHGGAVHLLPLAIGSLVGTGLLLVAVTLAVTKPSRKGT